ncbi:MAG: hypothetical protein LBI11_00020 [Streptococcaceae bacterium]|jgi:hypothetical protein|nr:hypothetical protein [Streptococcaceae bacterium]
MTWAAWTSGFDYYGGSVKSYNGYYPADWKTDAKFALTGTTPNYTFLVISADEYKKEASQPIYRLYNSVNKEHLYTRDLNESQTLSKLKDWHDEGVAWSAPTDQSFVGRSPLTVERLYYPGTGEHLYTMDSNEIKVLTTQRGWKDEGVAFNSEPSGSPVYRLYNPAAGVGAHFETMDAAEKDHLVSVGWTYEGIAWQAAFE